jgi:hypothetical protein
MVSTHSFFRSSVGNGNVFFCRLRRRINRRRGAQGQRRQLGSHPRPQHATAMAMAGSAAVAEENAEEDADAMVPRGPIVDLKRARCREITQTEPLCKARRTAHNALPKTKNGIAMPRRGGGETPRRGRGEAARAVQRECTRRKRRVRREEEMKRGVVCVSHII